MSDDEDNNNALTIALTSAIYDYLSDLQGSKLSVEALDKVIQHHSTEITGSDANINKDVYGNDLVNDRHIFHLNAYSSASNYLYIIAHTFASEISAKIERGEINEPSINDLQGKISNLLSSGSLDDHISLLQIQFAAKENPNLPNFIDDYFISNVFEGGTRDGNSELLRHAVAIKPANDDIALVKDWLVEASILAYHSKKEPELPILNDNPSLASIGANVDDSRAIYRLLRDYLHLNPNKQENLDLESLINNPNTPTNYYTILFDRDRDWTNISLSEARAFQDRIELVLNNSSDELKNFILPDGRTVNEGIMEFNNELIEYARRPMIEPNYTAQNPALTEISISDITPPVEAFRTTTRNLDQRNFQI